MHRPVLTVSAYLWSHYAPCKLGFVVLFAAGDGEAAAGGRLLHLLQVQVSLPQGVPRICHDAMLLTQRYVD
jgi:hypothetical protein